MIKSLEPRIGVVTVTYNSAEVLPDFLKSLRRQSFRQFRTYVIDNASSDGSVAALADVPDLDLVVTANDKNLGVAEGNNQGIRQARQDGCTHVLLLNNDTEFEADLFHGLLDVAISGKHPIVVPKIHYYSDDRTIWYAGGRFISWRGYPGVHVGDGEIDRGQFDFDKPVDYSPTCCMLVEMQVFEKVGLMDERYFVYYDDTDFCLRALRLGVQIWYTHKVSMRHKAGSLTGGAISPFTARMSARNKVYYLKKNFGWWTCTCLLSVFAVYITGRWLMGRDSWPRFRIKARAFLEGFSV